MFLDNRTDVLYNAKCIRVWGCVMKILSVLLPNFALRCEVRKGCPAVITYSVGSQKLVLDYSPELEGLSIDMPLQQALSKHGEVELIQADIPRYWSVFNEILDGLETKSPLVEGLELGQAYLDLDGMQLIYPDDQAVVKSVREVIPAQFGVRMGIAEGKFLAYLSALYSPPDLDYKILTGDVEGYLRDLSCDVLPVSLKSKSKLHDFGLHKLGQIVSLPPGPIQAQFGPEGKRIWELARGYDDTPLYPRCTEEVIEENTTLSSVTVSLEALLVTWEALLSRAFVRFGPKGMGVRSINLWTRSWTAQHWERDIQFKEPAMNVRSVISRIKQVIESYPQPGPVERLGIKVTGLGHQSGKQKSLFTELRAQDHLMDDIKQLELRMGSPQVFKIKEVEPWSRIPERRYALTPLSR
jgi:DNA polymerase-4